MGVGNDPRYTPSTTFDTFPFPEVALPNAAISPWMNSKHASDIAEAAGRLNTLRENWLNPPDLVKREPDLINGLPDRVVPVSEDAIAILKQRTMTNLATVGADDAPI